MNMVSVYSPRTAVLCRQSKLQTLNQNSYQLSSITTTTMTTPTLLSKLPRTTTPPPPHRIRLHCNSSSNRSGPTDPSSGDNESRTILDAFFLGKALAEAINERVESTVGEIFSTLGRLQAEQQGQVQDFQEDVMKRAQRAKEKAAREAMEAQGLFPGSTTEKPAREAIEADEIIPKSATEVPTPATDGTKKSESYPGLPSTITAGSTTKSSSSSDSYKDVTATNSDSDEDEEPAIKVSSDE